MTRSQIDIVKKVTYFALVLTLGGSVMWLSSGSTIFRSDIIAVNTNTNTSGVVVNGGLLGSTTSSVNMNTIDNSALVSGGANTPTNVNMNLNSSTTSSSLYSAAPNTPADGFATLASAAPYSDELAAPVANEYSAENFPVSQQDTKAPITNSTNKVAPQVVTKSTAVTPKSGPAEWMFVSLAVMLSLGVFYFRKTVM